MKKNKKSLKNKVVVTGAMVGAALVTPALVDTVEDITGVHFANEAHAYAGGVGTVEDPYIISNATDLMALSAATYEQATKHYKLGSDIDLMGYNFTPLFSSGFSGTFDGAGFTISNMNISNFTLSSVGFISKISPNGSVKNLNFSNPVVSPTTGNATPYSVGIVVGEGANGAQVENVHIKGGYIGDSASYTLNVNRTGAIAGSMGSLVGSVNTSVKKVSADVDMQLGSVYAGGLLGSVAKTDIDEASVSGNMVIRPIPHNTSNLFNAESAIGGMIGYIVSTGEEWDVTDVLSKVKLDIVMRAEVNQLRIGGVIGEAENNVFVKRAISYSEVTIDKGKYTPHNMFIDGVIGDSSYFDTAARDALRFSFLINDQKATGNNRYLKNTLRTRYNTNNLYAANGGENILKTNADLLTKTEYERYGYDFDSKWEMVEGVSAPRLKIHQVETALNASELKANEEFAGGSGTYSDPFLIATLEQFKKIEKMPKSNFKLVADLDFEGIPFQTMTFLNIENSSASDYQHGFVGSLDGNGYKIKNLVLNQTGNIGNESLGIFGHTVGAVFKNLTFENTIVDSGTSTTSYPNGVGVITGYAVSTSFENIKFVGNTRITSAGAFVGALAGQFERGRVIGVVIDGASISAGNRVGGLFGGNVSTTNGFEDFQKSVYLDENPGRIENVFINAKINGKEYVGGLIGESSGDFLDVKDVVIAGNVSGTGNVAGLINANSPLTLAGTDSFKNIILYNAVQGSGASKNVGGVFGNYTRSGSVSIDVDGVFAYNSYVGGGVAASTNRSIGTISTKYPLASYNKIYQYATIPGGATIGVNSGIVIDSQVNSVPFYQARSTMEFGDTWVVAPNGHPALAINPVEATNTFTEEEISTSQFAGGTGSVGDPYLVATPEQLKLVASNPKANFKLKNDIDLDGQIWTNIIGSTSSLGFAGEFDGNGFTIKNYQLQPTGTYQALFGYVLATAKIKNLNVENVTINTAQTYSAALVGSLKGGLENVTVKNVKLTASKGYQGGVAAALDGGTVDKLTATGIEITALSTVDYIGGVFGKTDDASTVVTNVVVDANVSGGDRVGIFAGNIASTGTYSDIMTFGSAIGVTSVGGYVGYNAAASKHSNIFVYANKVGDASVTKNNVGGIFGYYYNGVVSRAFSNALSVNSSVATYNGKAFGRVGTASAISSINIGVYNNIANGHSTKVNYTLNLDEMKSVLKQKQMGADFTGNWRMLDGKTPLLTFKPLEVNLVGGKWTYSPVNIDYLYVDEAQVLVNAGVAALDTGKFEQAKVLLEKISDSNTQKQAMIRTMNEMDTYLTNKSLIDTLRTNVNYSLYKEIKDAISNLSNATWKSDLTTKLSVYDANMAAYLATAEALKAEVDAITYENATIATISNLKSRVNAIPLSDYKPKLLAKLNKFESTLSSEKVLEGFLTNAEANISSLNARELQYKLEENFYQFRNSVDSTKTLNYYNRMATNFLMIELYEMNAGLYTEAEAALVAAEKDTTLEKVAIAEELINKLPNDAVKSAYIERLQVLKDSLGVIVDLEAAIKKTIETMKKADYDVANEKFGKLTKATDINKYKPIMTNLLGLVDAATAVEKVESTFTQEDLNAAQTLVNKIATTPEGLTAKKAELQARLDAIAAKIKAKEEFDKAEAAVKKAEQSLKREDAEAAQLLVDNLPAGDEKNGLQERLDVLFKTIEDEEAKLASIDEATKAVEKAETTKTDADIETAQEKVTALPDSDIKTELQERLDKLKAEKEDTDALAEATKAVVKAETTLTEVDFNDAQTKVTALKDSPEKDALQDRLDKLKAKLDADNALAEATAAVVKAEGSKADVDIDNAQTKVTALPDSDAKQALQDRLDKLKAEQADLDALSEATKAVEKVEATLTEVDFNDAQTKVTALKDSPEKTTLQDRLDKLKAQFDADKALAEATAAVVKAEGSKADSDIDDAQTKVTALPDGEVKQALQDRLDRIKADKEAEADANALAEATKAVEKAENTKVLVDVDNAQEKVTALKDSPEKDALQDRLDRLKAELENAGELEKATQAVEKAEATLAQSDVDDAQKLVAKLDDSPEKDALKKRLDNLQSDLDALAEATEAVVKAEGSLTEADINDAQTKVTALKDSPEKDALQDRLDRLKSQLEADKVLAEATAAVVKAEVSKADVDINAAQEKVTALPDSETKQALQDRLDKIKADKEAEAEANALAEATKAVEKAEGSKTDADINDAQTKVTTLKDSPEKDALQERLDRLKSEIEDDNALAEATKAVEKAEDTRNQVDIDSAQTKVTALPDSEAKQALQDRLDKLKAEIEKDKALTEAVKAVEKAEETTTDADIDKAQEKVTALPEGANKEALQDRIDKIKADKENTGKLTEAIKAVEKAEDSKSDTDINVAQTKVDALPEGTDKAALQDRINKIKAEKENDVLFQTLMNEVKAINKGILDDVIKASDFPATRAELETIRKRGEALTNVDQKNQLGTLIDATLALMNLVDKIEGGDKSVDTIGKLPDSKIKDKYLSEVAENDALVAAEKAVVKAEDTIALADIETAEGLVVKLAPSNKKEELKERLDAVRKKYEEEQLINRAVALVEQAESTKRITDIERAEDVVKQLKEGYVRDALQERLDAVRKGIDDAELNTATQAVEKAEELKTNVSIGYAKDKVNGLRPSPEKTALLDRIATLEKSIYDQAQMDRLYKQALDAVVTAENSSIVAYLNTAIKLVGKVSDADDRKQSLVDRVNAIVLRNQITTVDSELGRLELRPSQSGVEKVQGLINSLPDSVVEKVAFQTRLDAVKRALDNENYAKALKGAEFAESTKIESKRAAYYSALPLVDVLLDGERKTALEKRLAKVLAEVEAYEKLDGDYAPGDSVVESAQSIKDAKVKPLVLAWAKAVEDAELYNSNTLVNALIKAEQSIPKEIFDNPKYEDLVKELTERSAHIKESSKVFSSLVARGVIKKAYVAVLAFEDDRTEAKKKNALVMVDDLKRFKGHEEQVKKLIVRIERIKIETK